MKTKHDDGEARRHGGGGGAPAGAVVLRRGVGEGADQETPQEDAAARADEASVKLQVLPHHPRQIWAQAQLRGLLRRRERSVLLRRLPFRLPKLLPRLLRLLPRLLPYVRRSRPSLAS